MTLGTEHQAVVTEIRNSRLRYLALYHAIETERGGRREAVAMVILGVQQYTIPKGTKPPY